MWFPFIWTEIHLCHTCSCQEILRVETPGQARLSELLAECEAAEEAACLYELVRFLSFFLSRCLGLTGMCHAARRAVRVARREAPAMAAVVRLCDLIVRC
jgi:hypothetical protein